HKTIRMSMQYSKGNLSKYLWKLSQEILMGYGEKPFRTFLISIISIALFAFLYLFFGFEYSSSKEAFIVNRDFVFASSELGATLSDLMLSIYMSVVTFSTLGYGDSHPIGITRLFAATEALSGIILMALFIATFTRVTIR